MSEHSRSTTESAVVLVLALFPARQRIRQSYAVHCHPAPVTGTTQHTIGGSRIFLQGGVTSSSIHSPQSRGISKPTNCLFHAVSTTSMSMSMLRYIYTARNRKASSTCCPVWARQPTRSTSAARCGLPLLSSVCTYVRPTSPNTSTLSAFDVSYYIDTLCKSTVIIIITSI